jgi:hypothetical protein
VIFTLLSIVAMVGGAIYLAGWRAAQRRRNTQSWESIVARLQPDWTAGLADNQSLWENGTSGTWEERWQSIHGAHGLWTMHENARVMLEMANYALRNNSSADRELLAALRNDALLIRVYVLNALVKYAFSQVNEGICANASRAAVLYADMSARTAVLLQGNHLGQVAPSYVAAM